MVEIGIQMHRMLFELFELVFECFESCSNGSNFHSNALNPVRMVSLNCHSNASNLVRMVGICIRVLRITFEWLKFAFKWFESVRMVGIGIFILWTLFNWLELAFECFESCSNGWNWHSSASNPVWMVGIGILILRTPFDWLELAFECFKWRSNGWNWHSNTSNPVLLLELAFEWFESRSMFESCSTWENISRKCLLHNFTVLRNFLGLVHAFVTV